MTVQELMVKLGQMPADRRVLIEVFGTGFFDPEFVSDDGDDVVIS